MTEATHKHFIAWRVMMAGQLNSSVSFALHYFLRLTSLDCITGQKRCFNQNAKRHLCELS